MQYSVCRVPWEHAAPLLKTVRERVFICEHRIPKHVEFDRKDRQAVHMLVCDDVSQEPVATGRILLTGEIGRIAVIKEHRKQQLDKLVLAGFAQGSKRPRPQRSIYSQPARCRRIFYKARFLSRWRSIYGSWLT